MGVLSTVIKYVTLFTLVESANSLEENFDSVFGV
jgi:hypothetical protein